MLVVFFFKKKGVIIFPTIQTIFVSHWADVQNILLRFILILMVISFLPSVKLTVVLFRPQVQVSDVLERWQQRPSRSRVGGIGPLGPGTLLSGTLHENVSRSNLKTTCLVLCPDLVLVHFDNIDNRYRCSIG